MPVVSISLSDDAYTALMDLVKKDGRAKVLSEIVRKAILDYAQKQPEADT